MHRMLDDEMSADGTAAVTSSEVVMIRGLTDWRFANNISRVLSYIFIYDMDMHANVRYDEVSHWDVIRKT